MSLFPNIDTFMTLVALFYQTTRGFQTETSTSSSKSMLFKSPRPGLLPLETVSPPFPSRCITTGVNPVESATQDSTMSGSDVAPRIKFKRLDKTAKHIMQVCIYLLVFMTRNSVCCLPLIIFVDFVFHRF